MKVEVETLGTSRKLLRIEIPAEKVNEELENKYEELRKRASVPGFRRGRVPQSILKARFSEYIKNEVIQNLVPPAYEEAVKSEDIVPIGNLELKPDITEIELRENEPLVFEAAVDVKPILQLPKYEDIEIDKSDVDVPKEEVDKYIETLRQQRVKFIPIETECAVQEKDLVKVDWEYSVDEQLIEGSRRTDIILELGSGDNFPEIETQLIGMNIGQNKAIKVDFPAEHPNKDIAGKQVTFHVILQSIVERKLSELDDEFAKEFGYDNYKQLVGTVWNNLVEEGRVAIRQRQRRELVQQLIEKTPFDVPESLIEQQVNLMINNVRQQLRREGKTLQEAGINLETFSGDLRPEAIEQIKRTWIFDAIAAEENIEVADEELDRQVRLIAEQQNKDPQKYAILLKENKQIESIRENIRDEKIYAHILPRVSAKRSLIVTG
ncbi:trigger factor [bacterium]|nr:trigger factor [bacterium]